MTSSDDSPSATSIQSMTGSGAAAGGAELGELTVECRSVNGRGLSIKSRFVGECQGFEAAVEDIIRSRLQRGNVTVTIPIEPEDMTVPLVSVQVHYDNAEALAASGRQILSKTETLNLKLVGPRSELSGLKPQQLSQMFQLRFDWGTVPANLPQATSVVSVHRIGLSYNVSVLDLDTDDDPRIEYSLKDEP